MSLSREARIGLLVTIAIVTFCTGFYFLKGDSLFSAEKDYYCFYNNVQGLQTSSYVQIRGVNVGRVSKTQLIDSKGVKVTIALNKSVEVPKGTIASLVSADLLGNKMIRLDMGPGPGVSEGGETLATAIEGGLIDNISVQITPLLTEVRGVVAVLDTVLLGVTNIVSDQNQRSLSNAIASLEVTTKNFGNLSASLDKESGEITNVVHNANSITSNLANSNDNIRRILRNADSVSGQLSRAPIQQTFVDLQHTVADLQGVINKINSNQGSLGELVNSKDLYTHLNNSLSSLNNLMADIQAHPSRYINVTVFGKKKP